MNIDIRWLWFILVIIAGLFSFEAIAHGVDDNRRFVPISSKSSLGL